MPQIGILFFKTPVFLYDKIMKYLIDLDGTLLAGSHAINSSPLFIGDLQKNNGDFLIMTNSVKPPRLQSERLASAGMDIPPHRIINPLSAINGYLKKENITKVFTIGSVLEKEQIRAEWTDRNPEFMVLADFERDNMAYDSLQKALTFLLDGVPAVSASGSLFYLKEGKRFLDTGSFASLLERASETDIPVMGKPSRGYFKIAWSLLNSGNETDGEIRVIGDDWSTDIRGAEEAGLKGILIQSGKYRKGDEKKCAPSRMIRDLTELIL